MAFDIYQPVFDQDGEYLEDAAMRYREALMELFAVSVEGKTLLDQGTELGWADTMMDLAIGYESVTPAQMSETDLNTILLNLIPRKVSATPDQAREVIRELQLFWAFLQREFHLENAAACLHLLNQKGIVRRMQRELDNPENFGMAKSLIMSGMERGFDMSTQEGLDAWVATYNAELAAGTGKPLPLPGIFGMLEMPEISQQGSTSSRKTQAGKAKRKPAQSRRKPNRPKK
jgi:hypothetical protein